MSLCEMSLLVKCHNFRNAVITVGGCSLCRFHTVTTGTVLLSCLHKLHTDVVLRMCTQMYWCEDVFWSQLGPVRSCDHDKDDTHTSKIQNGCWQISVFQVYKFIFTNMARIWYIHVK